MFFDEIVVHRHPRLMAVRPADNEMHAHEPGETTYDAIVVARGRWFVAAKELTGLKVVLLEAGGAWTARDFPPATVKVR